MVIGIVALLAGTAVADKAHVPWYRGKYGTNRVLHLSITGGVGLLWLTSDLVVKDSLTGDCRWCDPPGFDASARDVLVWSNTERAHLLSNLNAYVLAPVLALGLLVLSDHDASPTRLIDDLLPIVETVVITQVFMQAVKIAVSRQRPYAHYGTPGIPSSSGDNLSFPSGHSSLGFALTTSAGLVAHWRGYWTEPYIWSIGIASSLTTEYLRIGADRHYLSDVLVGGFVGIGAGLLVPRLMRRDLAIVPVSNGAAVVGQF